MISRSSARRPANFLREVQLVFKEKSKRSSENRELGLMREGLMRSERRPKIWSSKRIPIGVLLDGQ